MGGRTSSPRCGKLFDAHVTFDPRAPPNETYKIRRRGACPDLVSVSIEDGPIEDTLWPFFLFLFLLFLLFFSLLFFSPSFFFSRKNEGRTTDSGSEPSPEIQRGLPVHILIDMSRTGVTHAPLFADSGSPENRICRLR